MAASNFCQIHFTLIAVWMKNEEAFGCVNGYLSVDSILFCLSCCNFLIRTLKIHKIAGLAGATASVHSYDISSKQWSR